MNRVQISRLALAVVAAVMLLSSAALADPVELEATSEDGILVFASDDGQFKWWIDTRIYLDTAFYMDDDAEFYMEIDDEDVAVHMASGMQVRRARMAWKAILWSDWYAEVDVDFAEEATELKDAYVRYDNLFDRQGYVRVGNFRTPFGLEENTSSRYLLFMERSPGHGSLRAGPPHGSGSGLLGRHVPHRRWRLRTRCRGLRDEHRRSAGRRPR